MQPTLQPNGQAFINGQWQPAVRYASLRDVVAPAGQTRPDMTITPDEAGEGCDAACFQAKLAILGANADRASNAETERTRRETTVAGIQAAAELIRGLVSVGNTAITQVSQTDRARITADVERYLGSLRRSATDLATTDPAASQLLLNRISQLEGQLSSGGQAGLSNNMKIGLAVGGAVVVLGAIYLITSRPAARSNPVVGRGRRRRYVNSGRVRRNYW